jgi:outer membrane protein assembly factor BamA
LWKINFFLVRKKINISIAIIISGIILLGCNTTRMVPVDKFLLEKVEIKIEPKEIKREEFEIYVQQNPNRKVLNWFKFHLSVYNFSKRGRQGKLRQWTERVIGEPPVIYDPYLTEKTVSQFKQFLNNKGYYHSIVIDSIQAKNKKLHLQYNIKLNEPYRINKISYRIDNKEIENIILNDSLNALILKDELFDVSVMQRERQRISLLLRNQGYYYLTKDYIFFTVDSNLNENRVNLFLSISKLKRQGFDNSVIHKNHKKYKVGDIIIYPNYNSKLALTKGESYFNTLDSTVFEKAVFYYNENMKLKPEVILKAISLSKNNVYRQADVESTKRYLRLLKYFALINIEFFERDTIDGNGFGLLDCKIKLSPLIQQSYALELEGTSSSANIGFGGNVNYQHKNIFHGAQLLDISLTGGLQSQRGIDKSTEGFEFNTVEYGVKADLYIPKFLLPINTDLVFKKYKPRTLISLSYNYQKRPDYTRSIANFDFGYDWDISGNVRNILNPIDLNFVDIPFKTAEFDSIISGTFLENSYVPFFIAGASNRTIVTDNRNDQNNRSYLWMSNIKVAGNLLQMYSKASNKTEVNDIYTLFNNNQYAQFIKFDTDYRRYKYLDKNQSMVFRFYSGIGVPYGNSDVLPFIEQYYSGGANGIRAWPVRNLGPGTFRDTISSYPNQLGDFKLEANIEYRFDLFWIVEGAFFIDAGNIWNITKSEEREEALFKFNRFYKEFAVGTGIGTRLDFSFFIFRIDWGVKLIDPSLENKWVLEKGKIYYDDWTLNIGIGYPF